MVRFLLPALLFAGSWLVRAQVGHRPLDTLPGQFHPIDMAVDPAGSIYLGGVVDPGFEPPAARTFADLSSLARGGEATADAFVAKLDPGGSAIEYLIVFGGDAEDRVESVAVSPSGDLAATGWTDSADLPTRGELQSRKAGLRDAFVAKISPRGELVYAAYLGGAGADQGVDVALGPGGEAFAVGRAGYPAFAGKAPDRDPGGGIAWSDDAGTSWRVSEGGYFSSSVGRVEADPHGRLWASTPVGAFRSGDRGETWALVGPEIPARGAAVSAVDPNRIGLATAEGFYRSLDGGETWEPSNQGIPDAEPCCGFFPAPGPRDLSAVAVDPSDDSRWWVGGGEGVYLSTDGGVSWTAADPTRNFNALLLLPIGDALYAGYHRVNASRAFAFPPTVDLARSDDGGLTWTSIQAGLGERTLFADFTVKNAAFRLEPSGGGPLSLWAATDGGLFRTGDGGANWTPVEIPAPEDAAPRDGTLSAFTLSASAPDRLYAVLSREAESVVLHSTDAGATWEPLPEAFPGLRIDVLYADPDDSLRLYASRRTSFREEMFLAKLSAAGERVEYLRFFGGERGDEAYAVAVDSRGRPAVAGQTQSADFPDDLGEVERLDDPHGFLYAFNELGEPAFGLRLTSAGPTRALDIAADAQDRWWVAGSRTEPTAAASPFLGGVRSDAFLARVESDGTLGAERNFGGSRFDEGRRIGVDDRGRIRLGGVAQSPDMPVTGFGVGCSRTTYFQRVPFTASFDPETLELIQSLRLGEAFRDDLAFIASASAPGGASETLLIGRYAGLGAASDGLRLVRVEGREPQAAAAPCYVNAASWSAGPLVPGEIFWILGAGLGPRTAEIYDPAAEGALRSSLAGVRVLVDGEPIGIVQVSDARILAVAPLTLGRSPRIEVEREGEIAAALDAVAGGLHPGVFTHTGTGVGDGLWNENGTPNQIGTPAEKGRVVSLYLTGAGVPSEASDALSVVPADGRPRTLDVPVRAYIAGREVPVEFVGTTPGTPWGFTQVNIRIPEDLRDDPHSIGHPMYVTVGGSPSQLANVWVLR